MPFPGFTGEVTYRICDFDGNGTFDLVFAPGKSGGGPVVKIYPTKVLLVREEIIGPEWDGSTGHYVTVEKLVAQCDQSFCYKEGIVKLECRGNRVIRVTFANGVEQDHPM